MLNQDRGATASYRTLARGHGGGLARAYRVAQRDHADHRDPRRRDLGRPRSLSSPGQATAKSSGTRPVASH
jgi:hypothetical protein